jgi:SAM-dependent methyltransferase
MPHAPGTGDAAMTSWPERDMAGDPRLGTPDFWEERYRLGEDGWELGAAAPPIARAIEALGHLQVHGDALVLGCGRGHEARLLAARGSPRVVAVDFAPTALAEARRLSVGAPGAESIEWREPDIFTLAASDAARFGVAIEHTCFCAIDPARRAEWARAVGAALRPSGLLIGLFYAHGRPGGPPFATTRDEVVRALAADAGLSVESAEIPDDSVERRRGLEVLVLARRP